MKTLIVDDSRMMRVVLRNIVKSMGHEVVEVANGVEAWDCLVEDHDFDLALVDWNMPLMNGFDLVKKIRADKALDRMAVMMVTTEAEMDHMQMALAAGANDYIMKPFDRDTVSQKVEMLAMGGFA